MMENVKLHQRSGLMQQRMSQRKTHLRDCQREQDLQPKRNGQKFANFFQKDEIVAQESAQNETDEELREPMIRL